MSTLASRLYPEQSEQKGEPGSFDWSTYTPEKWNALTPELAHAALKPVAGALAKPAANRLRSSASSLEERLTYAVFCNPTISGEALPKSFLISI